MRPTYCQILLLLCVAIPLGCGINQKPQVDKTLILAQEHIEEAKQYLDQGMLNSALAAFGLALEENPALTEAHVGMADIYRQRGNYEVASAAYERAANTDPTNFDAYYYLGLMKQFLGNLQAAIVAYLQAMAIDPDRIEVNRDLAAAYLQAGQTGLALPYAQRATELGPDSQATWCNLAATYTLMGNYTNAVNAYRRAAELGELADPVMLGLAEAHLHLGNYQRAINVLQVLRRRAPSGIVHERLGYARFKLRDFDGALESYRMAVDLNPNDIAAINGVGACLMTRYLLSNRTNLVDRDEAIGSWRRSVRIQGDQQRVIDLISRYSNI